MDLKLPYHQHREGYGDLRRSTRSAYTRREEYFRASKSIRKIHFELDRSLDTLFKEAPKKREKI